ncbi:unnamed protein product [Onchocerca flexuosa]|uniref:Late transcription factor VLTF-4 n=1 Tax=Onchocerca flexuosa TaxID=387005 RepID=A0A183H352_9BILA|nr:unnamed protein product [Onchocerca flexuosa]
MMDSDKIVNKSKTEMICVDSEVCKDDLLQAVVAEIVTNVVDLVCKRCISFNHFLDRFNIVDSTSFRNNNKLSESAFTLQSSSDSSDDEFDRILKNTRRLTSLQQEEEDDDMEVTIPMKANAKLIEHEYDTMPAIEELRIHVEEDILLKKLGKIVNIVDRLGNTEISRSGMVL